MRCRRTWVPVKGKSPERQRRKATDPRFLSDILAPRRTQNRRVARSARHTALADYRIAVDAIEDTRGLEHPHIIIHKTNLYGDTMSGAYMAETPVSMILQDALGQFFGDPNSNATMTSNFEISGKLVDFDYEVISGLWSSKLNSEMSVQLYLRNLDTGKLVWNESFLARAHIEDFSGSADAVDKMLSEAIDDLLVQIQSSEFLSMQLAAHSRPAKDTYAACGRRGVVQLVVPPSANLTPRRARKQLPPASLG